MGMPEDVRNKKKELRKKILALRNTLPLEERGKKKLYRFSGFTILQKELRLNKQVVYQH